MLMARVARFQLWSGPLCPRATGKGELFADFFEFSLDPIVTIDTMVCS